METTVLSPLVENVIDSEANVKENGKKKKGNAKSLVKQTKGHIRKEENIKKDLMIISLPMKSL